MTADTRFHRQLLGLHAGSILIGLSVHFPCGSEQGGQIAPGLAILGFLLAGWSWTALWKSWRRKDPPVGKPLRPWTDLDEDPS